MTTTKKPTKKALAEAGATRTVEKDQIVGGSDCPSWYPLPIYLKPPGSLEHWIRALSLRMGIMRSPQPNEWKVEKFLSVIAKDDETSWVQPEPSSFMAIRELTPYEAFKIASFYDTNANAEAKRVAALSGGDAYTPESLAIKKSAPEGQANDGWWDEFQYRLPVTIDLSLDDKSLVSQFQFWLTMMRAMIAETGNRGMAAPQRISGETLKKWHDSRLLAAMDLMTWRDVSNATYSDAAIASWLWPDAGPLSDGTFVDRTERLRKVTKPMIERVADWHTVNRLEMEWAWELFKANAPHAE